MPRWIAANIVSIAWPWPSARRIEDSLSPSAARIADCFSASARRIAAARAPSALRIADCFSPSAWSTAARLSRSARICFSIASWMVFGGSIDFSSMRLTRTPHFSVASSMTIRRSALIWSREVRVSSSVSDPTTLRSAVIASCSIARIRLATSYVARTGSVTW